MKRQVIVLVGSPMSGFDVYGPFADLESAQVWIQHRGFTTTNSWITFMENPEDN